MTAPPMATVQPGARVSSNAAVISHASVNAKVTIVRRANPDTLGFARAVASASTTATFPNAAAKPIEDVMAAASTPDPPDTA